MKITIKLFLVLCFLFNYSLVYAVDPRLHWNTLESSNFYIHYADDYESLARKAAQIAEQTHQTLSTKINWQPLDKTHLVISDESDSANGFAIPITFNRSVLFVAPPDSANGLEDFDDWLETLITHEYTHILHLDKVSGAAAAVRSVLGRHFLIFPNTLQPSWLIEGLATYYETDSLKGIGRGQSSVFKMMMRSEIDAGIKPVSQVNLPIKSWPAGSVRYLYGVHFYQFIEDKYGQQGVNSLIENYSNNVIPFRINSNSESVFKKNIEELWDEFSVWLELKYKKEMLLHKSSGLVEGRQLTRSGYNTENLDLNGANEIYYVENGAFEHATLVHSNAKVRVVSEVSSRAKINTHKTAGVLVTQNEFCDEYNINSDIFIIEKNNSNIRRVTECGRYRSASWTADGKQIIAVKVSKGISQLVLLNIQGEVIKNLWQGNSTDIVSQIKVSPAANKLIAAVFRKTSGWNIEEFDLLTLNWKFITKDDYIDMYPSYSDAGNSILFSSERSGRYQIYRYKDNSDKLEQLTRVATGAFNSAQFDQHSPLYYSGYNANGRDIYKLQKPQVLKTLPINKSSRQHVLQSSEEEVSIDFGEKRDYSAIASMYPRWWFPFISLSNDRAEYGITTSGNDALGIHNYFMNIAYDTTNEWLTGDINYAYAQRFSIGYQRSTDILRFNNGDFAVARNVDDIFVSVGLNYPGIEDSWRYQIGIVASRSKDGRRAEGVLPQADSKDNLIGGAVLFNNAQNYIRSISLTDGRNVRALLETSDFIESPFSGEVYTLDWREYFNMGKQNVLALRLVQGWGTDEPKYFRLGGEDNDFGVLDFINPISEPLFDKRKYALRGYAEGLPQLAGRRMQLGSLEWRFPGSLIERGFMAPPIGVIQWSGSVFVESGSAYNNASADTYYSSVGIELQADVNLFYGLTSRMRLGFASGFDKQIGEERIYFNLGASF